MEREGGRGGRMGWKREEEEIRRREYEDEKEGGWMENEEVGECNDTKEKGGEVGEGGNER